MKILWIIHSYPPVLNAGAEMYTHNLNKELIKNGHEVIVLLPEKHFEYIHKAMTYEDVRIDLNPKTKATRYYIEWADVVCTYLDFSKIAIDYVNGYRPIVWFAHNTFYEDYQFISNPYVHIVYNCDAAKNLSPFKNDSCVLRPLITSNSACGRGTRGGPAEKSTTDPINQKYITIINHCHIKGGDLFASVAKRMATHNFMAVTGGYAEQIEQPLHVKVTPHTNNISDIYNKTRILVQPSRYESWGMVASEAILNEIPVICTPCFGLKENMGSAAIYCDIDKPEQWEKAIRLLDNEMIYRRQQEKCRIRATELIEQNESDLKSFESFLMNIHKSTKTT
jgi:glycosyltransferase involved in cell wall biosynthesis